jgi:hypothetical protein
MLKLLLGTMALVGVLGFVACNGGTPAPGTLSDCPTKITVVSGVTGSSYSVSACQLKVGSSVTIEASDPHPVIGNGSQPLVTPGSAQVATDFPFLASTQDVGKTFGFKCIVHGFTGSIKVVAAM